MDYFNIGDLISVKEYNAIVYLLRKFKRLNDELKLGSLTLNSNYGTFSFDKPLTSVGGNFIIEEEVNISSRDCLRNCFYSFVFTVIDVNTSGSVNRRVVRVTGGTGDDGTLFVTLPTDLIESDEVILPDFELDIVFDEHEYYTPVADIIKVTLTVDKPRVRQGETATITAVLTDENDEPLVDVPCNFFVDNVMYTENTDSNGEAVYLYTGIGSDMTVTVRVIDKTVSFDDIGMSVVTATFTGGNIRLGEYAQWLPSNTPVEIDWGDGSTDTVNNPTTPLSHTYTDGESSHTITFIGDITSLGRNCFYGCTGLTSIVLPDSIVSLGRNCFYGCTGLTSIVLPDSIVSLGESCFYNCTGLTSVTIPNSITSLGDTCFMFCDSLVDYQLYWKNTGIIQYDEDVLFTNNNTVFTIPYGQSSNYISKRYPSTKLTERSSGKKLTTLSIQSSKASYYTDESVTLTGSLIDEDDQPVTSASVKIYQNNVLLDTLTTDSNGEYEKTLTGLNVGAYTFKAVYDGDNDYEASTSSNLNITVQNHTYSLSIASDKQTLLTTESVTITGTLLKDSTAFSGQSVTIYDGASVVDTLSTDGSGNYSKTISGLSVGVHTFKAVNSNAESSTISITVNEPTHEYNLSIQSDKQSMLTTESAIISGIYTVDGVGVSGETITIYDGSTSLGTATTTNGGAYTKTISNLAVGTHTIKASHTNVDSTTVSISVTEPVHDYALSVASTKDILSYADSESATITGTLTDGGVAVAGETLSYVIKHGSTTISSGSGTTNSSGQISFTYTSTGIGDVTVEVDFGILLQEIYELEDCIDADALTTNNNKFSLTGGTANISYSNTGLSFVGSASATALYMYTGTLPNNYIVEFDVVSFTIGAWDSSGEILTSHIGISETRQSNVVKTRFMTFSNDYSSYSGYNDLTRVTPPFHLKVVVENGTATFYCDNVQIHQRTTGNTDLGFKSMTNRGVTVKNMKIKAL